MKGGKKEDICEQKDVLSLGTLPFLSNTTNEAYAKKPGALKNITFQVNESVNESLKLENLSY